MSESSFRLVCWNLMAPEHAAIVPTERPDFYLHSREWVSWSERQVRIGEHLRALGGDVACLQEVSTWHVASAFGERLRGAGYEVRFAKKKLPTQPEGCATLVRPEVFEILEEVVIELDPERGHVALLHALRHRASGRVFEVVNLHVRWSPDATIQVQQTRAALAAIDLRPPAERIVCGDFNVDVLRSPLAADFVARGYVSVYPDDGMPTWAADERVEKVDAILVSRGLSASDPLPLPTLAPIPGLPSEAMPSDHLPLAATIRFD